MRSTFPSLGNERISLESLSTLSLEELRHVEIREKDEEELIQKYVDLQSNRAIGPADIDRSDIRAQTDLIRLGEVTEAELQAKVDERVKSLKGDFSDDDEVQEIEEPVEDAEPIVKPLEPEEVVEPEQAVKRYCETCTSKKGRHKKGCPSFK